MGGIFENTPFGNNFPNMNLSHRMNKENVPVDVAGKENLQSIFVPRGNHNERFLRTIPSIRLAECVEESSSGSSSSEGDLSMCEVDIAEKENFNMYEDTQLYPNLEKDDFFCSSSSEMMLHLNTSKKRKFHPYEWLQCIRLNSTGNIM